MADDWQQVGKRGRGGGAPAPARGGNSPARGQDRRGGGQQHRGGGRGGRGRGGGHRGRGNANHSPKAPAAAAVPQAKKEGEEGADDGEEGESSGSEEIEYTGQLLLADDSPDEAGSESADEPASPARSTALVASSSRKAEEALVAALGADDSDGDEDADSDVDVPLEPVVLPRREEPLQDLVRKRLGLAPKGSEPVALEPVRHRNYVCDKCKRCTEFTARRRGREVTCGNCGCDVLSHLQDEDEADADVEDRDYAPEYADVD